MYSMGECNMNIQLLYLKELVEWRATVVEVSNLAGFGYSQYNAVRDLINELENNCIDMSTL